MLELLQLDCLWCGLACLAGSQAGIITECCLHQVNKQPDRTVKFKPHRSLPLGADWHMVHSLQVALAQTNWNHWKLSSAVTKWPVWPSWRHIWGSSNASKSNWKAVDLAASSVEVSPCVSSFGFISRTSFKLKDRNQVCSQAWPIFEKLPDGVTVLNCPNTCRFTQEYKSSFYKDHRTKGRCVKLHTRTKIFHHWRNIGSTNTRPDWYSNLFWNLAKGRTLHCYILENNQTEILH